MSKTASTTSKNLKFLFFIFLPNQDISSIGYCRNFPNSQNFVQKISNFQNFAPTWLLNIFNFQTFGPNELKTALLPCFKLSTNYSFHYFATTFRSKLKLSQLYHKIFYVNYIIYSTFSKYSFYNFGTTVLRQTSEILC